jgi:hypothetical protein
VVILENLDADRSNQPYCSVRMGLSKTVVSLHVKINSFFKISRQDGQRKTTIYQTSKNRLLHHPINDIIKLIAILICKSAGRSSRAFPSFSLIKRRGLTQKERNIPFNISITAKTAWIIETPANPISL